MAENTSYLLTVICGVKPIGGSTITVLKNPISGQKSLSILYLCADRFPIEKIYWGVETHYIECMEQS